MCVCVFYFLFCFLNTKGDFGQVCSAGFCSYNISQWSLTFRSFMTLFDDAFEASETETSRTNLTKITSSVSLGLSQDALTSSGLTEDEETTATSSSDEAVRSGGVMDRLIHGTGPFPGYCCGLLHPQCSQQPADISDHTKMHKCNTKAVILTAQCFHNVVLFLY